MEERSTVVRTIENEPGSVRSYSIGFASAIVLTLVAFAITAQHKFMGSRLIAILLGLAIVQFVLQLLFFLHVGHETKPQWKRLVLFLMIIFVVILVLGSIWVMYSLNYRMTPEQINTYMLKQDGGI